MCGIAGLLNFPKKNGKAALEKMLSAIAHRGPDDCGSFSDKRVALGHQRLSIIDLSSLGHQPMLTADKRYVIVYNGEVYNYRDIRTDLQQKGYSFRSDSDTEVILYAFAEWGSDCLQAFNGMFAFAIYDTFEKKVFMARDRLGIKPLYLARLPEGRLIFASEIRAITQSGLFEAKLNEQVLSVFLKYQSVPPPQTLVRGIELLPAGHYLSVDKEGIEEKKYWDASQSKGNGLPGNEASPEQTVRQLFETGVQNRLIADVPLGAFLSGGIDSSLIVGVMSQFSERSVKTFTVAFEDERFEDGRYARLVAQKFNTEHTEVSLSLDDLLHQVPDALAAQDHPSGDGINTYIVSKAARQSGLTVVLSGLGGDELFAGYAGFGRLYRQQQFRQAWKFLPSAFRKNFGTSLEKYAPSIKVHKLAQMLQTDGSLSTVYPLTRQFYAPGQIENLLSSSMPNNHRDPYIELLQKHLPVLQQQSQRVISQISFAELNTYMHDVLLRDTDQMSMAKALEIRVPFLDHKLVEYVMTLSDHQKFKKGHQKFLLVNAFKDILPLEVVNRPKQGFIMPFDSWMRGPLREMCKNHLNTVAALPVFNSTAVQQMWMDFQRGSKTISWSRLWLLVALGAWIQRQGIKENHY